jgi:peptide deformylase
MILEIKKYPASVLKEKAKEVERVEEDIKELSQNMIETMLEKGGVGLAANQVGVLKRIIVVQTERGPEVFINPQIIRTSKEKNKDKEGCLSLPRDIYLEIKRSNWVEIEALNLEGKKINKKYEGFVSRIFQHEIDHLNGILIIDRVGFWQKIKLRKKFKLK